MNADVAYEILRYSDPIDRCRYRSIDRSFNEAALIWWRRTSIDVDFGRIVADNRRRRSKIVSFLQFLAKYCSTSIRYLRNFAVDDRLMDEIVDISISVFGSDLRSMFDRLEILELRCLRMANYDSLARFLNLFRSSILTELKIVGRYPMAVETWDGDETRLCAAVVDLIRLRRLKLCEMELKGDILTSLNPDLIELIVDRCPDVDDQNLQTMSAWCLKLERLRLVDVEISLETFRDLCALPRLTTIQITLNTRIGVTLDWLRCVCSNEAIEEASLTGSVEGSFGDLLDECPWPLLISPVDDKSDIYCLDLRNPNHGD